MAGARRVSRPGRSGEPSAVVGPGAAMLSLEGLMVLIGATIIAGIAVWIVRPLCSGAVVLPPPDPRAIALLTRREGILDTLRDLDSDFAAGRLGADDYEALRRAAVASGVAVLAALDVLGAERSAAAAELAHQVEADVLARRTVTATGPQGRACPKCGRAAGGGDDAFCARCGYRLSGEGTAAP